MWTWWALAAAEGAGDLVGFTGEYQLTSATASWAQAMLEDWRLVTCEGGCGDNVDGTYIAGLRTSTMGGTRKARLC